MVHDRAWSSPCCKPCSQGSPVHALFTVSVHHNQLCLGTDSFKGYPGGLCVGDAPSCQLHKHSMTDLHRQHIIE